MRSAGRARGTLVDMVGKSSAGAAAVPGPRPGADGGTSTDSTTAAGTGYGERLVAPASWWIAAVLVLGVTCGLVPLRGHPALALPGAIGGAVVGCLLVGAYGAVRLRVDATTLTAGRAAIPLAALGDARALDAEEARALRGVDADPRAYMLLRGYVRTAVKVDVTDPGDPTPYLYLSTRRPERLVAALARRGAAADASS